jgi:ribosomal protein S18 acetylase RimI-like enzyme
MWTPEQFALRVDEAMNIYVRAMNYPQHAAGQRAVTARRHATHPGFACRAAVLDDDTLVGFGYGYTTRPGQWWHDLVRRALDDEQARQWLGNAFELSELHVLPDYQGGGTGRVLLGELAGGLPHDSMLLSTPDIDTRAFRLYRHVGFVDLRRHYLFPGDAARWQLRSPDARPSRSSPACSVRRSLPKSATRSRPAVPATG